ncbi:hypothetical protein [Phenylobacterium sp.]|uniref:hypothetical protein n=1 Tax=Phenylobacterium sp. TaxID=1871053 RepID=UPI00286C5746|nr:hypothetical protein [Phenylobacterium sp.]
MIFVNDEPGTQQHPHKRRLRLTRTDHANFVVEVMISCSPVRLSKLRPASYDTGSHQVAIDCDPSLRLPRHMMQRFQIVAGEGVGNAQGRAVPKHFEGRVWVRLNDYRDRPGQTVNGLSLSDFTEYDADGLARFFETARALNVEMRMGVAPLSGAPVSVIRAK